MIVKVQISFSYIERENYVLIYNKDESVWYEEHADKKILKLMNGKKKEFFYAHINKKGEIVLGKQAPWQDW